MSSQSASMLAAHLVLTGRSQEAWNLVRNEECWNSQLAAAAPSQGYNVWAISMRSRVSRLADAGHVHWAVCHLLAVGDILQAVQLYMRHGMQREALGLARRRLHVSDPAFRSLLDQLLQALQVSQPRPHKQLQRSLEPQTSLQEQAQRAERQAFQHDGKQQQPEQRDIGSEGQTVVGVSHLASATATCAGRVSAPSCEAPAASLTMPVADAAELEPGSASTDATHQRDATVAGISAPTLASSLGLFSETCAGTLGPAAAAAASSAPAAKIAAAANNAATAVVAPRPVPPEVLALQGLLAGRPLLGASALRAAGTVGALATAAQLCAQVVRARTAITSRERQEEEVQQQQQQLDSDQAIEALGRACAAEALPAAYREVLQILKAVAGSDSGGKAALSVAAMEGDVQVACGKVQAAAATWGGAELAGCHCAVALLSWCVGRLVEFGQPEASLSRNGNSNAGGGVGAAGAASKSSGSGLGYAAAGSSRSEEAGAGDGSAESKMKSNRRETVPCLATYTMADSGQGGAAFEGYEAAATASASEGYDEDDEMALMAVRATYLGQGPPVRVSGRGGSAARRKFVATRQQQRPTSAPPVAVIDAEVTGSSAAEHTAVNLANVSMQALPDSVEDGQRMGVPTLAAADAAMAASRMWAVACAACGVEEGDPAVVRAAQTCLQVTVTAAGDIAAAAAENAGTRSAVAQSGIEEQGANSDVRSNGGHSLEPCLANHHHHIGSCDAVGSGRRDATTASAQGGEIVQLKALADSAARDQVRQQQQQQQQQQSQRHLETEPARTGSQYGAQGCCSSAETGTGAQGTAQPPRQPQKLLDFKRKAGKPGSNSSTVDAGNSGGGGGGGDQANLAVRKAMEKAMAAVEVAIYGLATAAMRAAATPAMLGDTAILQGGGAMSFETSSSGTGLDGAAQAMVLAVCRCATLLPRPASQPLPSAQPVPLITVNLRPSSISLASTSANLQSVRTHHHANQKQKKGHEVEPEGVSPSVPTPCASRAPKPGKRAHSGAALNPSDPASPLHVLFLMQQQDEAVQRQQHVIELEGLGEGIPLQQAAGHGQRDANEELLGDATTGMVAGTQHSAGLGGGSEPSTGISNFNSREPVDVATAVATAATAACEPLMVITNRAAAEGCNHVRLRYSRLELLELRRRVLVLGPPGAVGLRAEVMDRLGATGLLAGWLAGVLEGEL